MDSMLNATSLMPNYVQRFSSEGMHFRNAFVASPKCCPSRTSLLAGRFSHGLNDTAQGWCGNFITAGTWNSTWLANVKGAGSARGGQGLHRAVCGKQPNGLVLDDQRDQGEQRGARRGWRGGAHVAHFGGLGRLPDSDVPPPRGLQRGHGEGAVPQGRAVRSYLPHPKLPTPPAPLLAPLIAPPPRPPPFISSSRLRVLAPRIAPRAPSVAHRQVKW